MDINEVVKALFRGDKDLIRRAFLEFADLDRDADANQHGEAREITLRAICDALRNDPQPVPARACGKIGLAEGATFGMAVGRILATRAPLLDSPVAKSERLKHLN
jgi:hypothetical protein